MDEAFKNKIIADIRMTGFPSELKAASILRKHQWTIEQNGTYIDYESNRSREIDIKAVKYFSNEDVMFSVFLIIEVKKSKDRPWIFFTSEPPRIFSPFNLLFTGENFKRSLIHYKNLQEKLPRTEEKNWGISFYEAFKSPNEPSKIYEALMSSIKASFHEAKEHEVEQSEFDPEELVLYASFLPIIILDGSMCKATFENFDESITVEETEYLATSISHSTEPYDKYISFYPDVMTMPYLETFLQKIDLWGESVLQNITQGLTRYKARQ